MNDTKQIIAQALLRALDEKAPGHGLGIEEILGIFETPPERKMGDLAFPCFKLSRTLRQAPPKIAAMLCDGLHIDGIEKIEVAGGYLNFFFDDSDLAKSVLTRIFAEGERYGGTDIGKGKTIVLDYSSPNVAKPFHIGHLGTTVIGHSLKRLYAFNGYHCVGVNHLGDWGTQFGKLIVAYRKFGNRAEIEAGGIDALVALYVRFHKEAEADPSLNDEARAAFAALEKGDDECVSLWKWFVQLSLKEYQVTYDQLGITFDSFAGESFYTDKMPAVIEELRQKGLLTVDQGATIVDLEKYGMPPCIILKSDGSTIYATRDITAALWRRQHYDFDKCIYVTSAGQSLHFAQWFKVIELMGYPWAKDLIHVPYGTVSIDGAKLATRTGNVVLLRDLFSQAVNKIKAIMLEKHSPAADDEATAEAVGIGAVVFYYLSNNRMRDINFVMDDVLSFEGNTGPYAQYTYARTCSILKKAGGAPGESPKLSSLPLSEQDRALVLALSHFPDRVAQALRELEPSVITRYILELCAAFNRFYHDCPILGTEDEALRTLRTALVAATNITLKNAFPLICLKSPEKI